MITMKKIYILISLCLMFSLTSCVKDPSSNPTDPIDELDLNFTFNTRITADLSITATNSSKQTGAGVLFSVYTQDPYDAEGERILELSPIYQGYTGSNGIAEIDLSVPSNTTSLYVVPEYAGYGSMQIIDCTRSSSANLSGLSLPDLATKAEGDEFTPLDRINCGNTYRFWRYFTPETDYDPSFGVFNPESSLVSYENISNEFLAYTLQMFPEAGYNYDRTICTDIVISEDGTEVWLTYIGDGGYTNSSALKNILNSLMYYTYDDASEITEMVGNKEDAIFKNENNNITYAIINGHPDYTACGTKVQLLYWDRSEQKYIKEFPAGTHIGFALLNKGYNTVQDPKFSLTPKTFKASTPEFYPSDKHMCGLMHWSETFQCYVLGLENGEGDDADFNDLLAKINTSKATTQVGIQPTPDAVAPSSNYEGTLAYEDLWPYEGDYDFNDFVTKYQYSIIKNDENQVTGFRLTFKPMAVGASDDDGFGIQLPVLTTNIASIENGELEGDNVLATVKVYDNVRKAFNDMSGNINTFTQLSYVESTPVTIIITLSTPVDELTIPFKGFNPFLFKTNNRGSEIHMVDYPPTLLADMSLLGTGLDKSDIGRGIYYRMDNQYAWALDIAGTSLSYWKYPTEMTNITNAYLHYNDWVTDHQTSWFDWTVPGNANESLLYQIPE